MAAPANEQPLDTLLTNAIQPGDPTPTLQPTRRDVVKTLTRALRRAIFGQNTWKTRCLAAGHAFIWITLGVLWPAAVIVMCNAFTVFWAMIPAVKRPELGRRVFNLGPNEHASTPTVVGHFAWSAFAFGIAGAGVYVTATQWRTMASWTLRKFPAPGPPTYLETEGDQGVQLQDLSYTQGQSTSATDQSELAESGDQTQTPSQSQSNLQAIPYAPGPVLHHQSSQTQLGVPTPGSSSRLQENRSTNYYNRAGPTPAPFLRWAAQRERQWKHVNSREDPHAPLTENAQNMPRQSNRRDVQSSDSMDNSDEFPSRVIETSQAESDARDEEQGDVTK